MKPTIKIVWNPQGKGDKRALRLRVIHERDPRTYTLGSDRLITKEEFTSRRTKEAKIAFEEIQANYNQAKEIANELGNKFTFSEFSKRYHQVLSGKATITPLFSSLVNNYMERTDLEQKTKILYRTASNWLYNVCGKDIKTDDIDESTVHLIIKEMKANDVSLNSVRMYIRALGAMYSYGIKNSLTKSQNPFRHIEGLTLTSTRRQNASLNDNELLQLLSYKPQTEKEQFGWDFFVLSLQLSGMNVGDILRLKNQAINNNEISFTRKKTSRLEERTTIPLTKEIKRLLSKYGKINLSAPNDYILPYLANANSEKTIINTIGRIVKRINHGLSLITEKIGMRKVTTYTARHTFAIVLQARGKSVEQIQKLLGHASSTTTQNYIGTITTSTIDEVRDILESLMPNDE